MPVKGTKREMFHDLRHGKQFGKTNRKFGKKTANRQMVAIVLQKQREKKHKGRKSSR